MIDALKAELIKLRSTRSPFACLLGVVVVSLLIAAAAGVDAGQNDHPLRRDQAIAGLLGYGLVLLMTMAALTVTTEFGTGTIRVTFAVFQRRTTVILAKATLAATICALTTAVLIPAVLFLAGRLAHQPVPMDDTTVRLLWGLPLVAALTGVLAVGVATLIRRTAGVVAILIAWPLLVEGLTTLVPRYGERIATFMPFANANLFLGNPQGLPFAWSPAVGLGIFTVVAVAFLALAMWAVTARDA